jgi:hypothetical protein
VESGAADRVCCIQVHGSLRSRKVRMIVKPSDWRKEEMEKRLQFCE